MRSTSIEAWKAVLKSGYVSKQQQAVYKELYRHGPLTQQEVQQALKQGKGGGNGVTPRFSELERMGLISVVGNRICSVTNHNVNIYDVTSNNPTPLIHKASQKEKEVAIEIVKKILNRCSNYFESLPDNLKQEMLHYDVNEVKSLVERTF